MITATWINYERALSEPTHSRKNLMALPLNEDPCISEGESYDNSK